MTETQSPTPALVRRTHPVDQVPPVPKLLTYGFQHVAAFYAGAVIVPLIVGPNAETMALAAQVQARGFDVRGIRPPTVPEGTSRLRVSLTLNATRADVLRLAETLEDLWPDL